MKKLSLVLAMLFFTIGIAIAQRTITGKVTDGPGEPLVGATVLLKGTSTGTTTDVDGNYSIKVPTSNGTIVISYTGYTTREIELANNASNVLNVTLEEGTVLSEVVVSALGIKRDARQVGYSAQQVTGDALTKTNAVNVVNALAGQVAGLNVNSSSGAAGASTYFTIRGQNSLTGNNQPLMVVDGIILNNDEDQTNAESGTAGVAHSNRGVDINPNDIESINVLKGGAAAALYGIRAANGVILITTKKGGGRKAKGLTVDFNSTVTIDQISQMPALQNEFSQGSGGVYQGPDKKQGSSFGPAINTLVWSGRDTTIYGADWNGVGGSILYQDERGIMVDKSLNPNGTPVTPIDNIKNFFQNGLSFNNSVAVSGGNDDTAFRLSFSNLNQKGVVPTNTFNRTTIGLNGSTKLSSKMSVSAGATYINSGGNRVQQGSNTSGVMLGLLRTTPTFDNSNGGLDVTDPRTYEFADGSPRAYRPTRYDSPFWIVNKDKFRDNVNRLYGYVQADYKILSWLTLTAKSGADTYSDRRKATFAIASSTVKPGRAIQDEYTYLHTDSYLYLNGNHDIGNNLNLGFVLGGNYYDQTKHQTYVQGDAFSFNGFDHLSNATSVQANEGTIALRRKALYASADLSFKNMLYLTVTGRNEWSSTLPVDNNSFFYPSVSLGYVFADGNEGLLKGGNVLTYGKLRASWAQVGNDADPYSLNSYYSRWAVGDGYVSPVLQWPHNGINAYGQGTTLGNAGLKPETTTSSEIGADLRFFKGRVGVDVSLYRRNSKDLIVPADIAPSTGATNAILNTGELESNGVDLILTLVPVSSKNFNWNINLNFNRNRTMVKSLAPGLNQLQFLSGFGAGTVHIPGEQYGLIYGAAFERTAEGKLVIDDEPTSDTYGQPLVDQTGSPVIGNPNPNWTMGINNTFNFKGVSLGFLFDIRDGSQMWNGTRGALVNFGMAEETEDRGTNTVYDGVLASTTTYNEETGVRTGGTANNIQTELGQNVYQQNLSGFTINEPYVEKSNWVRLRTVQLGYTLPTRMLTKTPFGSLGLSFIGRNLWLKTPYSGVDPETNLTGANLIQGLDYFNMPGTKSYAFSLNVTF